MNHSSPPLSDPSARLELPDILRGFALFGILIVNLPFLAGPIYTADDPTMQLTLWDRLAAAAVVFGFQGKFYVLFSLLFGYGLARQMARPGSASSRLGASFARRLSGLLVIGGLHAVFLFMGDILVSYSLLGLILWCMRDWPTARLVRVAAALLVVAVFARLALAAWFIPPASPAALDELTALADQARAAYRGGFMEATWQRCADLVTLYLFTPLFNWPTALAMFALGLAAGRQSWVDDPAALWLRLRPLLPYAAPLALVGNFAVAWSALNPAASPALQLAVAGADAITAPVLTLSYIGAVVRLHLSPRFGRWLGVLRWPGRMSLTNYLGQALVGSFIFNGWGLGYYDQLGSLALVGLTVIIFTAQVGFSRLWLARYRMGPDEWILRAWTYLSWPQLRRPRAVELFAPPSRLVRSLLIAAFLHGTVGQFVNLPHPLAASTAHAAEALLPSATVPTVAAPTASDFAWWQGFADSQLDALITETLAANPDLRIAVARLGVAQAALTATHAARRPSLDLGAGAQRRAYSRTERAADPTLNSAETTLSLGPTATYEFDLWGRLAHGTDAAAAEARAAAEDAATLRLTLTSEVATTWFSLRANTTEAALLATRQAHARAALALLTARQSAGLADAGLATTQRATLADFDHESAVLTRERATLVHRLAALRGLRPEAAPLLAVPSLDPLSSHPLPADLTTAILTRRPDLRAAAARLTAQQSRLGEARAAALPALALSAQSLFTGESIRELLRAGSLGSFIAAQISVPLLDGGRRAARTKAARAELVVATDTYAALVVRAFQETADALAAVVSAHAERIAIETTLTARHKLHALAEARHSAGLADGLTSRVAFDEVLAQEIVRSRALLAEHHTLIALIKTLGGDWSAAASADDE